MLSGNFIVCQPRDLKTISVPEKQRPFLFRDPHRIDQGITSVVSGWGTADFFNNLIVSWNTYVPTIR